MNFFNLLSNIINPVTKLIDDLHTSEEEKLAVKQSLFEMQNQAAIRFMEYEKQLLEAQSKVITAEATGQSWIQRSWRPITMLTFLALVVLDSFGILENRLASEAWTLLQIGLGGYVIGRSVEKAAPKLAEIYKNSARG